MTGDGATDDAGAVQTLIDGTTAPAVLFFPTGTYRLESLITLKSGIVLRGAGSNTTHFEIYSDNGCMSIKGRPDGSYVPIQSGFVKGSKEIVVEDASGFEAGKGGMIRQEDIDAVDPSGEWAQSDWVPEFVVGQMVKTAILVEDNIFNELRHAMIIQLGGNGCVFGYNYAQRNYSDDGWDKTYISVHGHYPYMNLFEGNIVGNIGLADYWGACGPGNTLFRNRVIGTDKHEDFGPYRGIAVDDYSHQQNIIGNELTGAETRITFDGNGDSSQGTSKDILVHGNNVHGTIAWDSRFADHILPSSFYLAAKPSFFGTMQWPSLGGDNVLGTGTIPAKARFDRGEFVPQPGVVDPSEEDDPPPEDDDNSESDPDTGKDDDTSTGEGAGGCFVDVLFGVVFLQTDPGNWRMKQYADIFGFKILGNSGMGAENTYPFSYQRIL